jgi:hypothetical protein
VSSSSSSYRPPAPVTSLTSPSLSSSPVSLSYQFVTLGSKISSRPISFAIYAASPVFLCYPVKLFVHRSFDFCHCECCIQFCNFLFVLSPYQFCRIIVTTIRRESYHLMPASVSQLIQLILSVSYLKGSTRFKSSALVSVF